MSIKTSTAPCAHLLHPAISRRILALTAGLLGLATILAAPAAASAAASPSAVQRGWQKVSLAATGSYFMLYVPASWDVTKPAPLVVFLHGAGGTPEDYQIYLAPAAEQAACLVAAPKSSSDFGWGVGNDDQIIAATAPAVAGMLSVDPARIGIAGHSAGGAEAYLTAYGTANPYSAVFTLSAPFYAVTSVVQPAYKAPIRMYYGTTDPNYSGGDYDELQQQWNALDIAWQGDVVAGYGHDVWPPASMANGFLFLKSKAYGATCTADANHLCLAGGRYRVGVTWDDGNGHTGAGTPATAVTDNSAVFWFFDPGNWEMLVKVLDGCAVNQRIWVFSAATTNVAYTLSVTDTFTGQVKTYPNAAGQAAVALTDTGAFTGCPTPP